MTGFKRLLHSHQFLGLTSSLSHSLGRGWGGVLLLALVQVELRLDGGLCVPPAWVSRELSSTGFADSEHRHVSDPLYDPKIALRHEASFPQERKRRYCNRFQTGPPLRVALGVLSRVC